MEAGQIKKRHFLPFWALLGFLVRLSEVTPWRAGGCCLQLSLCYAMGGLGDALMRRFDARCLPWLVGIHWANFSPCQKIDGTLRCLLFKNFLFVFLTLLLEIFLIDFIFVRKVLDSQQNLKEGTEFSPIYPAPPPIILPHDHHPPPEWSICYRSWANTAHCYHPNSIIYITVDACFKPANQSYSPPPAPRTPAYALGEAMGLSDQWLSQAPVIF